MMVKKKEVVDITAISDKIGLVGEVQSFIRENFEGCDVEDVAMIYVLLFKKIPSTVFQKFNLNIEQLAKEKIANIITINRSEGKISNLLLRLSDEFIIKIVVRDENSACHVFLCCDVKDAFKADEYLEEFCAKYVIEENNAKTKVNFVLNEGSGFYLTECKLKKPVLDLELNYGKGFTKEYDKLISVLSEDRSGLIIFRSVPGTGKSTLIEYLTDKIPKKKFVYMNADLFSNFDSPQFTSFAMADLRESIIILEDCESIITSREFNNDNRVISTLLNLTSGIFANVLNCKVICTFNADKKDVDQALLRGGRLLMEYEFRLLTAEEANLLHEKLYGVLGTFEEPIPLCDVYNKEKVLTQLKPAKRRIGF